MKQGMVAANVAKFPSHFKAKPVVGNLPNDLADMVSWFQDNYNPSNEHLTDFAQALCHMTTHVQQKAYGLGLDEGVRLFIKEREKVLRLTQLQEHLERRLAAIELILGRVREDKRILKEQQKGLIDYFERTIMELYELAYKDPKTGLMNKPRFQQYLDIFLRGKSYERWCLLVMIDLRGMGELNDRLGYLAVDDIVRQVANILREIENDEQVHFPEITPIEAPIYHARFGGDEFNLLMPTVSSPKRANYLLETLHERIRSFTWSTVSSKLSSLDLYVGAVVFMMGPKEARFNNSKLASDLMHIAGDNLNRSKRIVKEGLCETGITLSCARLDNGKVLTYRPSFKSAVVRAS